MARKKPHPTAELPPTVPAPAAPAESVIVDAPPAVAGGELLGVPFVVNPAVGVFNYTIGRPRFRCIVQGQPGLVVEAADAAAAIETYKAEYGILSSDHPFVAEPVTT
jgi:hypothetical protein